MKKILTLVIAIVLTSCSSNTKEEDKISDKIYSQLKQSEWKSIEFSKSVPFHFDKVCLFGPYSTNERTKEALGFYWDIELKTQISGNDGINVIVFVKNNEVISYVKHPRHKGDFWRLSSKCFDYKNTKLTRTSKNSDWTYNE